MKRNQLRAAIVGAGHRAIRYASYAHQRPQELTITAVADPSARRRELAAKLFEIPQDRCFHSAEELAGKPPMADAIINGTMDQQHVPTSLPLLEAGYDILLEKPFATNEQEMWQLQEAAARLRRKVMVCHVLRYAPFYRDVRRCVLDGAIGEITNIQTIEHVSYHHMGVGFLRGKWRSKRLCGSSMLMSKCCHDLDLIAWMKSGVAPVKVASFGGNMQFAPQRAPAGSGTRCLVDCKVETDCMYSARKHYLDHPRRWSFYIWGAFETADDPDAEAVTAEQRLTSLKTDNPYGVCVWKSGCEVVDHQSVAIEFEDGCTATHNMVGGTARSCRSIHLVGTKGEIQGDFELGSFVVRGIDTRPGHEYSESTHNVNAGGDMHGAFGGHGGGDSRLMEDFLKYLKGEPPSISCTNLEDSIRGHLIGFRADAAREQGVGLSLT